MWRWTVCLTAVLLVACAANTPPGASDTRVAVPGIARDSSDPTATTPPAGPGAAANDGTCGSATPTTGQFDGNTFTDTFDGAPPQPTPWCPSDWDIAVHSRDENTWDTLDAMDVQHGDDCSPPPATHHSDSYAGAVHQCKDHVMTAINGGGYAAIYLTPGAMVDFSNGMATVKFDVSTARTSERDWIDLWITPFADNLQLPLEDWLPDLQGPPRRALQLRMDNNDDSTFFRGELYDNFAENKLPQATDAGYETVLKPSATTRTTFELDISRTHIRFGMPAQNLWWIDTDVPALSWSGGVVQLAQHSYNPSKACDYNGTCGPNTWHWDNVSISPAVPFAIDHGTSRFVSPDDGPGGVSFSSPAAANSFLRFSAIGTPSVSFDGGHTWQQAARQAQELSDRSHYASFWMPIPAGTQTVQVRFAKDDWYDGPFRAQDFAVWTAPG